MNRSARETFTRSLIGNVPSVGKAAAKGAAMGVLLFTIFELVSVMNPNVPRVPVAWLMVVATVAIETVILFRLVNLLGTPRQSDVHFILRMEYVQRIEIARYASRRTHNAFIPFMAAVLATAAVLELTVLKERSLITLCIIPCGSLLVMAGTGVLCQYAIGRQWFPVAKRDDNVKTGQLVVFPKLRKSLSVIVIRLIRKGAGILPNEVRVQMMRNLLYLMRGEIVLTLLIVTAAPVLLLVLLLMVGDPLSPFVAFIPLLAAFLMGYHFTAELEEAADILPECHWYRRRSRSVLTGNFVTLLLPVLSIPVVFCCVSFATLCSGYGIVRLLNFGIAFVSTVAIGVFRLTNRVRKDQDVAMDLMLFALIAVGLFVPWVGGVFAVAALLVMVLVNWSVVERD